MTKYTIYYSAWFIALSVLAGYTLYTGSLAVYYGQKSAQLEKQKTQLTLERTTLKHQVAQATALSTVATSPALESYQTISRPMIVQPSQSVAALQ